MPKLIIGSIAGLVVLIVAIALWHDSSVQSRQIMIDWLYLLLPFWPGVLFTVLMVCAVVMSKERK